MKGQIMPCQTSLLTRESCSHHTRPIQISRRLKVLALVAPITVLVIFALLLSSVPVFGQSTSTGTVVGTVTDQSGAVVPDATVTITNKGTNTPSKTQTNSAGHYAFVNVDPGVYDVKITKQGFETANVPNQTVEVGKQLTEDLKLTVGSVTQEVTVETTGTELQTLNATVGNDVSGTALDSLPAIGRDVSTFAVLQPGVSPDGSVAGTVVDQSSFQLDGGQNSSDMDGSQQVYTPSFANDPSGGIVSQQIGAPPTGVMPTPIDSVEEFKVNTANQTADFNSSSGAQVQVVTKRGTNTLHGTVYEYYLDNNFSANTWDNNLSGTPQPSYHYSRFGAALGGPIIPKDILGGKTYLFGNFEGFRWPNSDTIERSVPSANMEQGILTFGGVNYNLKALDPRGIGIDPTVQKMWLTQMPQGNDPSCGALLGSRCDGINTIGFKGNVSIPQHSNFGVARLDHDFGQKWHFTTSYRYYNLSIATTNQIDIGGALPGDKLGVPTAVAPRPQVPWFFVAGLTTNITSNTTNDVHYSFLRNYWAWNSAGDPAQLAGLGGALEPLGEQTTTSLSPYNVNAQATRTRFWDGHDNYLRDDITMLHGNHLFSFGGIYQRNWDYHQRTDNGGGINYYPVYQLGDSNGAGTVDMTALAIPSGTTNERLAAAALGIVTDSQIAYTRSGANLALNPPLTPASDKSTIPYYNVYFSDSWHVKPNLTFTYGLGWTLEMPPTEESGKQVELVDAADQPIDLTSYLASRERLALQGQVFNPEVGFALLGNTANSPKYPYLPFYGSFSPRVAVAWNPHFSGDSWLTRIFGEDKTVIRGGYGRIYGRLNGVDQVLVPLLGEGLIQAVQCKNPLANGTCPGGSLTPTVGPGANMAFRIGVDGNTAPIPAASPTLPQPVFPGVNDVEAGAGEALDPHFRPNDVDSFDLTIQRQLSNRVTLEFGYIGRLIHHEYQPININAVPYMMTLGGQQFQNAYANIEKTLGCATSVAACGANVPAATIKDPVVAGQLDANPAYAAYMNALPQQAFFTASLNSKYCATPFPGVGGSTPANCTAAVVGQEAGNFTTQAVWNLWSDLDNGGGTNAGFIFPNTMLNTAGQLSSGVGVNASIGHGNYNAGFVSVRSNDWRGLTLQSNFTYSKALGTGAFVQATSEFTTDDPFDLNRGYGVQAFNRKYVYNLFTVYQPPFFKSQGGVIGHLLGGWSFAPIFSAGSGAPVGCGLNNNGGATSATGSQEFGAADGNSFFDSSECIFNSTAGASAGVHTGVAGGTDSAGNNVGTQAVTVGTGAVGVNSAAEVNLFSNPLAVWNNVRAPILGLDTRAGGEGPITGLPYWNVDFSVTKHFKLTERFSTDFQYVVTNLFNHNVFFDPFLDTSNPSSFGVLSAQGNKPRAMQFGLRVSF